jgi:hypothetical protein
MHNLRDSCNSIPSTESSSTCPSLPISSVNDGSWDIGDMDDSHKRYTKHGVSTFIRKLFR